mgnify:CR=1 FL=1
MIELLVSNAFAAVVVLGVSGAAMILARSWRWRVAGLALQYVGVFWLVALSWPVGLASIKLVVGWMAGAILGISGFNLLGPVGRRWPTEWLFLGLVLLLVVLSVSTLVPEVLVWLPGGRPAQAG